VTVIDIHRSRPTGRHGSGDDLAVMRGIPLGAVVLRGATAAAAEELEPRSYSPSPVRTAFVWSIHADAAESIKEASGLVQSGLSS
jgi:hypothetical protein